MPRNGVIPGHGRAVKKIIFTQNHISNLEALSNQAGLKVVQSRRWRGWLGAPLSLKLNIVLLVHCHIVICMICLMHSMISSHILSHPVVKLSLIDLFCSQAFTKEGMRDTII